MIKLKDILREFETGNVLLGEPTGRYWNPTDPALYSKWKELGIPYEPNTIDEKQLVQLIRDWVVKMKSDPELGDLLQELLPLKTKFPIILDPTKGRNAYEGTTFYRGTLLPLSDLIYRNSGWKLNTSPDFPYGAIESNIPYTWEVTGQKGFTSFTPVAETADGFAADYMQSNGMRFTNIVNRLEDGSGMIPVILTIPDTYPEAIMNPKIMNVIGGLGEYEVLVLGKQIKVKSVIVPNWKLIQEAAQKLGVDLTQHFKGL